MGKGIKTSSAKAKGRSHQQAIKKIILARYPWLGEGDVESCSMGAGGVDIKMSPLARKTLPLSIEAKATKKTPSLAEIKQARENAYKGTTPTVIWSPHGSGPDKALIMFDLQDFLDFYDKVADKALADIAWKNRCESGEQKETENE
jgi:hypothetical protein